MAVKNPMNAFAKTDGEKAVRRASWTIRTPGTKGRLRRRRPQDDNTFYVSAEKHAALKTYCRQQGRHDDERPPKRSRRPD